MSGAGDLDLRTPIGALFVMLGVILMGYGIATNGDATSGRARSRRGAPSWRRSRLHSCSPSPCSSSSRG